MTKKSQNAIKLLALGLTAPAIIWLIGTLWAGVVGAEVTKAEIQNIKQRESRYEKMFVEIKRDVSEIRNFLLNDSRRKNARD